MISHSEHFEWLLKIGMGWFGWTEQQTLDTSMPAIILAREGRAELIREVLKAVYGEPSPEPPAEPQSPISDDKIRSIIRHLAGPKPEGSMS